VDSSRPLVKVNVVRAAIAWWNDDALRLGANIFLFLLNRLQSFGLVVAIGFLLMVSLTVSAAVAPIGQ
jgi:hypothetical protein